MAILVLATIRPACSNQVTFDVSLKDSLNSRTARIGQPVHGRLVSDLRSGRKLVAPAGSEVVGHVTKVVKPRRLLHAEVSPNRWLHAGGGICMQFDKVIPAGGKAIKLKARPIDVVASQHHSESSSGKMKVSKTGTVEPSRKRDLKPKAARTALGIAAFVGAPFTPIIGGVAGAVRPSTVLPEATDAKARRHRRLKGLATGFVAGLPGGFLVDDAILKGQDAVLRAGTRLRVQGSY